MDEIKKQKLLALKEKAPAYAEIFAPIYKLLLWKWGNEVPDEKKIESLILNLLDDLIYLDHEFVSTGGIIIRYNTIFEEWQLLFQFDPINV